MNNRRFYDFCRDQRKREQDPHKRTALIDLYDFIREVGITRRGVEHYIDARLRDPRISPEQAKAYEWLREAFSKHAPASQQQGQQALL